MSLFCASRIREREKERRNRQHRSLAGEKERERENQIWIGKNRLEAAQKERERFAREKQKQRRRRKDALKRTVFSSESSSLSFLFREKVAVRCKNAVVLTTFCARAQWREKDGRDQSCLAR
jgi:hypothetical protein